MKSVVLIEGLDCWGHPESEICVEETVVKIVLVKVQALEKKVAKKTLRLAMIDLDY